MKRHFENLTDRVGRAVQHWWLLMLAGILCFVLGIAVFAFPMESYVTLSILSGVLMLLLCWVSMVLRNIHKNSEKEYPR